MKKPLFFSLLAFLISAVVLSHIAQADVQDSGLKGWWNMDSSQISGGVITDLTGNGNSLTEVASPTSGAGRIGQAIVLNGSTQYASTTLANNVLGAVGPYSTFTMAAWVRPATIQGSSADRRSAIGRSVASGDFEALIGSPYVVTAGSEQTVMGMEIGKADIGSQQIFWTQHYVVGQWYHVVGVFSNCNATLYVNGVQRSSAVCNATVKTAATTTNTFSVGTEFDLLAHAKAFLWNGSVDDARIYNRALTAGDVAQLYEAGLPHYSNSF